MIPFKYFILSTCVMLTACGSEPSYVPASERMENQQTNGEPGKEDGNEGETGSTEETGDKGNQTGNEIGEGAVTRGHTWVDLGLSVKWAASNLDASNAGRDMYPETPGSLFKWGAVTPVSSSEAATGFPPVQDETDIAGTVCDAATALWGAPWRMPTEPEFAELLSVCDMIWENSGYRFVAPNGSSIFLPAAGYCDLIPDTGIYDFQNPSAAGRYWSATSAISLGFIRPGSSPDQSSGHGMTLSMTPRYCACSIRPVCP